MRMSDKLAKSFCEFVCSDDQPYCYRDFTDWAEAKGHQSGHIFWSELALLVRDCGHKHVAHVLYRLSSVLSSELSREKGFIQRVGQVFEQCAKRFGATEQEAEENAV
jgi:hypothetical protein